MNRCNVLKWLFAFYVHVLLLISLIDIWPKEMLQEPSVVNETCNWGEGPADRIIIFFVDSVSSRWMFNFTERETGSFISSVLYQEGCAGISLTEDPVSILTGLTAILVGTFTHVPLLPDWVSKRPQVIESVLDRVDTVTYFGSEEVLEILERYSSKSSNWMKFTTPERSVKDNIGLKNKCTFHNEWISNRVTDYYSDDYSPSFDKKSIIFIHLTTLDCDENRSNHFSENHNCVLQFINKNIEKMSLYIDQYYGDNKTTFLFTSGYGDDQYFPQWLPNSVSSSHITSTMHIQTPLIIWGPGIAITSRPANRLNGMKLPIMQTSITPLIGTLLGVGVPSKSMGLLSFDYLNMTNVDLADAAQCNARHFDKILQFKANQISDKSLYMFSWFNPLTSPAYIDIKRNLNNSFLTSNYSAVNVYSQHLSFIAQREIEFAVNYYKDIVSFFICCCIILWVVLLLTYIMALSNETEPSSQNPTSDNWITIPSMSSAEMIFHFFSAVILLFSIVHPILEGWPFRFSLYASLSVIILWSILLRAIHFSRTLQESQPRVLFYTAGTFWIAFTFDNSPVNYFSLIVFFAIMTNCEFVDVPTSELQLWLLTSLAAMPLVIYVDSSAPLVALFTSVIWLAVVFIFFERKSSLCVFIGGIILMVVCIRVGITDWSLINNCSAPYTLLIIGWLCFVPIFCIPLFGSDSFLTRTLEVAVLVAAPYLLMNSQLEAAAMLLIQLNLLAWVYVENHSKFTMKEMLKLSIKEHSRRGFSYDDTCLSILLRRSFTFIVYIFYVHLASGSPILSSFFNDLPDNLFPCIRSSVTVGFGEVLKHFFQILIIATYLSTTSRISRIPISLQLTSILYFCSIFSAVYLLPFFCLESPSTYNLTIVSRVWIGIFLPILVLLAVPIAYYLTAPSHFVITFKMACLKFRHPGEPARNDRQE